MLTFILCLTVCNSVALSLALFFYVKSLSVKANQKPTQDLADFLDDVKRHGYGVVRLDPDSLLYVSPRSR